MGSAYGLGRTKDWGLAGRAELEWFSKGFGFYIRLLFSSTSLVFWALLGRSAATSPVCIPLAPILNTLYHFIFLELVGVPHSPL